MRTILMAAALAGCGADDLTSEEIHTLVPCNEDWLDDGHDAPPIDGMPRCERACQSAAPLFYGDAAGFCLFSEADTARIIDEGNEPLPPSGVHGCPVVESDFGIVDGYEIDLNGTRGCCRPWKADRVGTDIGATEVVFFECES